MLLCVKFLVNEIFIIGNDSVVILGIVDLVGIVVLVMNY